MSTFMIARRRLAHAEARTLRKASTAGPRCQPLLPWPTALSHLTNNEVGEVAGMERRQVLHLRQTGLTVWMADRLGANWSAYVRGSARCVDSSRRAQHDTIAHLFG